jgi:O-antigen/teichoic acid export membrane protein
MAVANASWLMGARLLNDLLSLVLFGVIAREFGPAGLGVYSTFFAIATILYELVALGIDDYGVREFTLAGSAERPILLQRLMRLQLTVGASCVAGLALFFVVAPVTSAELLVLASLVMFQLCNALARTLNIPSLVHGTVAYITVASVASRLGVALVASSRPAVSAPTCLFRCWAFPFSASPTSSSSSGWNDERCRRGAC